MVSAGAIMESLLEVAAAVGAHPECSPCIAAAHSASGAFTAIAQRCGLAEAHAQQALEAGVISSALPGSDDIPSCFVLVFFEALD